MPSFRAKPLPGASETAESTRRPPPSDGSDIDHSDPLFHVSNVLTSHKLILNKFCVFRPQYLLLTLAPTRRQTEPLGIEDLTAAWATLRALDGEQDEDGRRQKHYVIYNGGVAGGSSRKHKHMQVLAQPRSEDGDLELLPYREGQMEQLPIQAFFTPLDKGTLGRMDVLDAGRFVGNLAARQWRMARDALGKGQDGKKDGDDQQAGGDENEDEAVAHNVMLTQDWLITIPRLAATVSDRLEGHVVGCQGVLGSVWCSKEEQLQAWKHVGLKNVLKELGVAGKLKYC